MTAVFYYSPGYEYLCEQVSRNKDLHLFRQFHPEPSILQPIAWARFERAMAIVANRAFDGLDSLGEKSQSYQSSGQEDHISGSRREGVFYCRRRTFTEKRCVVYSYHVYMMFYVESYVCVSNTI